MTRPAFPFTAIVGLDDAKLALLLNAVDPTVGGVLLRGSVGSGRATLVRALPHLLGSRAPLVTVPVGMAEAHVLGTADHPGLVASAHGGVLYLDDVGRQPIPLVESVLAIAADGPARFVLVGGLDAESPGLPTRLLDRFGLSVEVGAPADASLRAEAVARRLTYEADPVRFASAWQAADEELSMKLGDARPASLPAELVRMVSALCARLGAPGLRADLTICRAAAALAGWDRRRLAGVVDVRRVAPLALAHRCRRGPWEGPSDLLAIADAIDDCEAAVPPGALSSAPPVVRPAAATPDPEPETTPAPARPSPAAVTGAAATVLTPRSSSDVDPSGPQAPAEASELIGHLVVLAVDASGTPGADTRIDAAKTAITNYLRDAHRRDLLALVVYRGFAAEVILRPTSSVEIARARLTRLPTGGKTPLAEGISTALRIATLPGRAATHRPVIVLLSGGRATHAADGGDPMDAALRAAKQVSAKGIAAVVLEVDGSTKSGAGVGPQIADAMGARYLRLPTLAGGELDRALRQAITISAGSQ